MNHVAVVPFARPARQAHVQALIDANPAVQFVVAANGRGNGVGFRGAIVLSSRESAGAARNVGVEWALAHGVDTLSFLDDDDYYGPDYLAEAQLALESADVVHKGIGFVRLPDGLHLFDSRRGYRMLLGNSISARVATCPLFSERSSGEEMAFTLEARRRGLREAVLPPFGFVYDRSQIGHAYVCSPVQFLRAHGPAAFLGDLPDSVVDLIERPSDAAVFNDLEARAN
jgi:glycosyltransferase involved in cell wall biosynthesis